MKLSKVARSVNIPTLEKYFNSKTRDSINLTIGEPDFDLDENVRKKLGSIKQKRIRYSSSLGNDKLRFQISDHINSMYDTKFSADNILITTGSSYSLFLAYQTLLNPNDEIIVFEPYFPPYIELAKIVGAKVKIIPTFPDFIPSIDKVRESINNKTKAIVLNSPNNPTGKIYPKEFILNIVEIARKNDLYIISDEVYKDFDYDNKFISPAEFYSKTIIVNSFSKSHAATGLRLGYICSPIEIIEAASKFLFLEHVCVSDLIQELFVDNLKISAKACATYKENRELVTNTLKGNFDFIIPDGGFYFFIKIPEGNKDFITKLTKNGVLVMPGNIFCNNDEYFRISLISDKTKLKKALKIIKSMR